MNRWHVALMGIIAILVLTSAALGTLNNEIDATLKAWQKVETAYQQRVELLDPYIMYALRQSRGSAETTALAKSYDMVKSLAVGTSAELSEIAAFLKVQDELTAAIAKLVVSRDIYPKLLADPSFRSIHSRLDEIESMITLSTEAYNRALHEQEIKKQGLFNRFARMMNSGGEPEPSAAKSFSAAGNGAYVARPPAQSLTVASN